MDEVRWLKSLDRAAGSPRVSPIDVAPGVMRAVRSIEVEVERVFPIAAAAALVAGVVAVALMLPSWLAPPPQDPLAGLADAFNLVLR